MGMDVYGKNSTFKEGEYFRNNVWWWRPLADYILQVAPQEITSQCEHWGSNDGDGLEEADALALAKFLREEVQTGRCKVYADERASRIAAIPQSVCDLCNGSGIRSDEIGVANGMTTRVIETNGHPRKGQVGWCDACDGVGKREPFEAMYPFSVDNVEEFCTFLEACGGFEIH